MAAVQPRFDELIHAPLRLRICAALEPVERAEFSFIRDLLEVSDSVTSKHLGALAEAGYVVVRKTSGIGRPKTWVSLTPNGRQAYAGHIAALREIVAQSDVL